MNLFVLPTHREGFPNTILEAQAAELPVITTLATGAVDSLENGVSGLLTPVGDVPALADAVLSLLSDPAKLRAMGRLGRERVMRTFRNETVWEALASLYETLLLEADYPLCENPEVEAASCAEMR
jgi:glycosyltransferase involved in cell wall biosynthesis